ncbi:LytR family transcriptional regulator [Halobacillus halophilus]|uniref:LytR family transcription regulator n=1 Tax=Halobacillus halophilus (strain ATCC 35676 / DSM 2266 / JCM 20832 / KCTC 3685 / LMG 17431 / NBRC 102448 / NCIMB 2269) TaxID=866895 RepID=I0JQL9_HALH3|nr:LCP family protein [Halobacillus halophilus]ASF40449.1 LytR family transcriptional regulator [Halobacillus halophilus]CCG46439.1 LytR family transcription regulator [Halobacillus halophilus DSM 2266]
MNSRKVRIRKRKRKKKIRRISVFLLMLAVLAGGTFYYVSQVYTASFQALDRGEKSDLREEAVNIGDDPISILLMGVEDYSTDGSAGRADTQIVMTLDPKTNQITMTSLPRDTEITLPEEKVGEKYSGEHKLNATYSIGEISGYGSEKLAVETVENYLDIPIDKFATVNFEGFIKVVNLLNGVTVDVKEGFWERSSQNYNKKIEFEEGPTAMNGEEALAFVRMRKREAALTYPREERQRQFIQAAIDEAISAGTIFKAGEIADVIGKNITTNLSPREIYALQKAFSSESSDVKSFTIEGENKRLENGLYYFVPNEESLQDVETKLKQELDLPGASSSVSQEESSSD